MAKGASHGFCWSGIAGVRISGLDISEEMLACVPAGINKVSGMMTELPFADSAFDCVYATESLEHAVEIDRAVAEMCRVLKPGGKLAIIDKNSGHWGRFKTPAWERWFERRELEKLLERDCTSVQERVSFVLGRRCARWPFPGLVCAAMRRCA